MKLSSFLILAVLVLMGCATTAPSSRTTKESRAQEISAMSKVAEAVSGKTMTEADLRALDQQIRKDPQAQSAVQAITNAVSGQAASPRFCPFDGERFSPKFEHCPVHHVPLQAVGP